MGKRENERELSRRGAPAVVCIASSGSNTGCFQDAFLDEETNTGRGYERVIRPGRMRGTRRGNYRETNTNPIILTLSSLRNNYRWRSKRCCVK